MNWVTQLQQTKSPLYQSHFDHDACGFGLRAHIQGKASHQVVKDALQALDRLTHRGAIAADGKTGDGCGVLIVKPESYLRAMGEGLGFSLGKQFAVGMVFLSADDEQAAHAKHELEKIIQTLGLGCAGWRTVPIDPSRCGESARATLPQIEQIFVTASELDEHSVFEQKLFRARRLAEKTIYDKDSAFYIASLSARSIVYKAMVMPSELGHFYQDLCDQRMTTNACVFHQRFSTNTLPQWWLAQPFRLLAHNGEINTLQGNRSWATARGSKLQPKAFNGWEDILPMVEATGSDSSSLDNMVEALLAGGMDVLQALRILIPPAWETAEAMDPDVQAFFEFFAAHIEPWDGPAAIVLSDDRYAVCALDRNGLRPARYTITDDHMITIASETGVIDYPAERIIEKGKLGPGDMLAVDLQNGKLLRRKDIEHNLKSRAPYRRWLDDGLIYLDSMLIDSSLAAEPLPPEELSAYEKMFNVTTEERTDVLKVLATQASEAIGSMGDDTPLAVLSKHVRSPYDFFRQMFAQVTNPPIDPLRETQVMSLLTRVGKKENVLAPEASHAKHIALNSPILSQRKLRQILSMTDRGINHRLLNLNVDEDTALQDAIKALCLQAESAVREGALVLVLSDRYIKKSKLPIHALLATGAVHNHLVNAGLRCDCNLIVETGTARDPHHFACLIGMGATAVYPFMAYQCLNDMLRTKEIDDDRAWRQLGRTYRRGIRKGLLKIMSKMGISTITSYRSAKLFEIIGLNDDIVSLCFPGTVSRIQGLAFTNLHADQKFLANRAWNSCNPRDHGGQYRYVHGGEYHMYGPEVIGALRKAAFSGADSDYKIFADLVNHRPPSTLRDLLGYKPLGPSIAVNKVEPIENILSRFECAGMSLGAIAPEAHEALAVAMNRIGGRSNSGEGGEDRARIGTDKASKIKQIASGRFGVTPEYLIHAEAIQIKIAQGAKPGEGGQLPGHKVNAYIAKLRYSSPGVSLISPPPHHDIYSIEDLAQLIFDLKQVNPKALISVKLVAGPGVGTIAVGVAKAYADQITISGHDGGTGASPLTSVRYAGGPWELGLAETQQLLCERNMRHRIRLQADGGLKTGLDVVKAALLGAESFGFGTAPLITLGCKYLRICHLNNCATGVATQHETLREKFFLGKAQFAINYFQLVAEEVRTLLAQLGATKLEEIIGRSDLLETLDGQTGPLSHLDLTPLISGFDSDKRRIYSPETGNPPHDKALLAKRMTADSKDAVRNASGGNFSYAITNADRSIGAALSGSIAKAHGNLGMSEQPINISFKGNAGQSFGAFNAGGLHLTLSGDANDYVGKGMAGGSIVITPPSGAAYLSHHSVIMGNTCLYGATGGLLLAAGTAGERFAVRNSGAIAVIEGAGDHCCEYMTGGVVTVLGETGINFGAGMTGGFAYVLDLERDFADRYNNELIDIHRLTQESTEAQMQHLRSLLESHYQATRSLRSRELLGDFRSYLKKFWIIKPKADALEHLLGALRDAA